MTIPTKSTATTTGTTITTTTTTTRRWYISGAHRQPRPVYGIQRALENALEDVEQRKQKRALNWERFLGQKIKRGVKIDEGPYRNLDETIEFAINLNVDPRKPGQMLRGSVNLPHGIGKRLNCIVFTMDADLEREALAAGATYAGGLDLIDDVVRGTIPLDLLQRALATPNMVTYLNKAARLLGPRGLMPNAKVGTLLADHLILNELQTQISGQQAQYRTDKEGIIHMGIGKGSFPLSHLVDNVRALMQEINEIKPETYGKGSKKKKNRGGKAPPKRGAENAGKKYLLRSHVTSTFGKSFRVDVRTIDPTHMFFMTTLPTDDDDEEEEEEEEEITENQSSISEGISHQNTNDNNNIITNSMNN